MKYFVTAIGTDCGKTVTSAILSEALGADYWKPIQAGTPTDTDQVKSLVTKQITLHPERYLLKKHASPHDAAKEENIEISLDQLALPSTNNSLIIEGAGGVMVPINDTNFVIDIARRFDMEVILVCNLYLGSINHSLLTINYLKSNQYRIKGIIFNGQSNTESERIILHHAQIPCLIRIKKEEVINKEVINYYANKLKGTLQIDKSIYQKNYL